MCKKETVLYQNLSKSIPKGYFIKEIENIFPRVPICYRNTCGSLGELEIGNIRPMRARVSTSISP